MAFYLHFDSLDLYLDHLSENGLKTTYTSLLHKASDPDKNNIHYVVIISVFSQLIRDEKLPYVVTFKEICGACPSLVLQDKINEYEKRHNKLLEIVKAREIKLLEGIWLDKLLSDS